MFAVVSIKNNSDSDGCSSDDNALDLSIHSAPWRDKRETGFLMFQHLG